MATKTIEAGKIYQLIHDAAIFVLIVKELKGYPYIQGADDFKTLTPGSNQFKHRIMYHCEWKEFGKE